MKRISAFNSILLVVTISGLMLFVTAFGPQGCENREATASSVKESSSTQSTDTSSDETTAVMQAAAYLTEADSLYDSGDFYKALRAYKRVLTVDPGNTAVKERIAQLEGLITEYETYYNLGMEFWYKQNYSEALKEFNKALALYPTNKMVMDHIKTLKQILGIS